MASGARPPLLDLRLLGRHQVAAAIATGVDFGLMIALVELARIPPAPATFLSAIGGGLTNFALSRAWAFRARHEGSLSSQAGRYAAVSLGGALLNALLLGAVLRAVQLSYVVVRALVSLAVSVLYTFPMHTRVVFRVGAKSERLRGEATEALGALSQVRLRSEPPAPARVARDVVAVGDDAS